MKFQINPTPQIIIAVLVAVLTLAAKGTVALPLGVPAFVGEYLTSWSNFILQIYAVVAPIMLGFSSSIPGPLAPPDPPAVVAATKAAANAAVKSLAFFALAVALVLHVGPARADSIDLMKGLQAKGVKMPLPLPTSAEAGPADNVFSQIADWVGGDLAAAETLATQNTNLQDWTGYACWKAAEDFSTVLKAHPVPVTLKAASDAEALRLATAAAKRLCQNSACQTVSGDLLGGIAQMGLGVPPPVTLQTLCAKIPSITLGSAPTPLPASLTTPAPTPSPSAAP